jgi:hypothetical protein
MQNSSASVLLVISSEATGVQMMWMNTAGPSNAPWALLARDRVAIRTVIGHCHGYGGG